MLVQKKRTDHNRVGEKMKNEKRKKKNEQGKRKKIKGKTSSQVSRIGTSKKFFNQKVFLSAFAISRFIKKYRTPNKNKNEKRQDKRKVSKYFGNNTKPYFRFPNLSSKKRSKNSNLITLFVNPSPKK